MRDVVESIILFPLTYNLIELGSIYRISNEVIPSELTIGYNTKTQSWQLYFFKNYKYKIRLFDTQGKIYLNDYTDNNFFIINGQSLNKGMYIIEINRDNMKFVKKVIKY